MACNPNDLLEQARCFQCLSHKELQQVIAYLLCQISESPSGQSSQLVQYTSGTPANPPNLDAPAFAYDPTGNLPSLGWNTSTHTWN